MTQETQSKKVVTPLDENGKPVDWWFMYKFPKMDKDAMTPSGASGYDYVYYDPHIGKLVLSPNQLKDGKGALDLTLNSVFDHPASTTGWILYNDEMPLAAKRKDDGQFGHTKGVIAFDTATDSAFWLLHSWPKFADPKSTEMPTPEYGQTFLCLSLDMATAGIIANQMDNHQEPQLYLPRLPESLSKTHPLCLICQDIAPNATGDSNVISCSTKRGLKFKVIAKNRKWGKDFWNDLVGPTLKADMDVETWIRGAIPPMQDSDGSHKVYDVKFIDFHPLGFPYTWSETHDHAKWGITVDADWVCVGDINRMISQEKRGGGTIAFQDSTLWNALHKTDLLKAPAGHTLDEVKSAIKSTHKSS
jgi:deoxyribonuclease-2